MTDPSDHRKRSLPRVYAVTSPAPGELQSHCGGPVLRALDVEAGDQVEYRRRECDGEEIVEIRAVNDSNNSPEDDQ